MHVCRKERYFELSVSVAAHSYTLKYFKGANVIGPTSHVSKPWCHMLAGPGKPKACGEVRIDQVVGARSLHDLLWKVSMGI